MDFITKVYLMGQLTGFLTSLVLFLYAWRRRNSLLGRAAMGMMLALIVWLSTGMINLLTEDPNSQFIWMKIGYLGVFTLPVGWFAYALTLSGYERWVNRRVMGALLVIPAFLFYLVIAGPFFVRVDSYMQDNHLVMQIFFSAWIWLSAGYFYLVIGIGTVLMARSAWRTSRLQRFRSAALFLASVIPLVSNLVYLTQFIPMPFDITPLTFAFSGSVLVMGTLRYRLFDPVPIGRGAVVDLVKENIIVIDEQGVIADLNQSAQEFLGMELHIAVGQPLAQVLPALAGLPAQVEVTLAGKAGPQDFEVQVTPLLNDDRMLVGHLIILRDITVRKQVENGLQLDLERERELSEMRSRFYSYFTHQLRTPLSVVLSSSELLEHYGRGWEEEKRRIHFQRIYQAVDHLLDLADRATTYERNERNLQPVTKAEEFNPRQVTRQLIDEMLLSDHRRHPIELIVEGAEVQARQDLALVRAVLENIIGNALKFSPVGKPVQVCLVVTGAAMEYTVRDEGCGIPADELARVKQPFFRASNAASTPGTGLGLAIVNQHLAQLGGQMQLQSQENVGTLVTLTLPLDLPS